MRTAMRAAGAALVGITLLGCDPHDDLRARFELERQVWLADRERGRVTIDHRMASHPTCNAAIASYEDILSGSPLRSPTASEWRSDRVRDMRHLVLESRVALAELYFRIHRSLAAGTYFRRDIDDFEMSDADLSRVQLDLARSLYPETGGDSLATRLATLFEESVQDELYWSSGHPISYAFFEIPLHLARVRRDRGDVDGFDEFCQAAHRFYSQTIDVRRESRDANRALHFRLRLNLLRGQYEAALADIDKVIGDTDPDRPLEKDLLLRGRILTAGLGRHEEAAVVLDDLLSRAPDTGHLARFHLAEVHLRRHQYDLGFRLLREIESDRDASDDLRSRAMLLRAVHLQREGYWGEALLLLKGICRSYPYTISAVKAPLLIGRHFAAQGDTKMAQRSLGRAREFYLRILGQASVLGEHKLLIEDVLVESFLLRGREIELAILLESESARWTEASRAGAIFKAGMIYHNILGDRENAAKILKKCVELFPETRYSRVAQEQLN